MSWVEDGRYSCLHTDGSRISGGYWQPLQAQGGTAAHDTTVSQYANYAGPQVDEWLTEALKQNGRVYDRTAAERNSAPVYRRKMTPAKMNEYFDAYLKDEEGQSANLHAALLLFAPAFGRKDQCKNLLRKREMDLQPDDILVEFAANLLQRIKGGQYPTHDGKIENWIGKVWQRWFFPDTQKSVFEKLNLETPVNEQDLEDDDEGDKSQTYTVGVAREIAKRQNGVVDASEILKQILRELNDPNTLLGQVDDLTKRIVLKMFKGQKKQAVATELGLSLRTVNRKLEEVKAIHATRSEPIPEAQDALEETGEEGGCIDLMAAADSKVVAITRSLTTAEAAEMLGVRPATLRGWKLQRIGPPFIQLSPRCVRYAETDIIKYVNERRVVPSVRETREAA